MLSSFAQKTTLTKSMPGQVTLWHGLYIMLQNTMLLHILLNNWIRFNLVHEIPIIELLDFDSLHSRRNRGRGWGVNKKKLKEASPFSHFFLSISLSPPPRLGLPHRIGRRPYTWHLHIMKDVKNCGRCPFSKRFNVRYLGHANLLRSFVSQESPGAWQTCSCRFSFMFVSTAWKRSL